MSEDEMSDRLRAWLDDLPEAIGELAGRDRWVGWDMRGGRKLPINPHDPRGPYADPSDSMTWASLERALAAARGCDLEGVGYVLDVDGPYVGVDLDDCLSGGTLDSQTRQIVDWLDSYTEVSPSGDGVKVWVRDPDGVVDRAYKSEGVEVYPGRRYFTVTAEHFGSAPQQIRVASEGLGRLIDEHFAARDHIELDDASISPDAGDPADFPIAPDDWVPGALSAIDPDCPYDQWVGVGMALRHDLGESAFDLWDDWSSGGDKYDGTGALERKWQSFGGDPPAGEAKSLRYIWWLAEQYGWQYDPAGRTWLDEAGGVEPKPYRPETHRADLLERKTPPVDRQGGQSDSIGEQDEGEEGPDVPLRLYDYAETYRDDSPYEPDLVAPGVLGTEDLAMIFGPPKSMKTWATMAMCRQWAMGEGWMDMEAQTELTVVYLNFELKQDRWRERSHQVDLSEEELSQLEGQFYYTERFLATLTRDFLEACVESVAAQVGQPVDLLVVDPIAQFFPGDNESDNQQVSSFIRQLRRLASSLGEAATLLVHHAAKAEYDASFSNIRGASAFRGAYDTGMYLHRESDDRLVMEREGRNAEDLPDLSLSFDGESGRFCRAGASTTGGSSERLAGQQMGEQWDREQARKARLVCRLIRSQAKQWRVFTKRDFGDTFGSHAEYELGSSRSIQSLIDELLTKRVLAYFDAGDYGGPSAHGNSAGHLCCADMVVPPAEAESIDDAGGEVQPVQPATWELPGHPEPVGDRRCDAEFVPLDEYFVES